MKITKYMFNNQDKVIHLVAINVIKLLPKNRIIPNTNN